MMPDLGKYAADVLSAYAVSVALIVGLVVLSLRQAGRARRALEQREGHDG
ncbi:MAG: heme exporter protein CcmD [Pseudomonadota bacterium]